MVEADFVRFYSLDLSETIEQSPRRVISLMKALPSESMLVRSHTGGTQWTWDQELAATEIEMLHAIMRVLLAGFGAKRSNVPKPLHIDRPYERQQKRHQKTGPKRNATVAEMRAMLDPILTAPSRGSNG